MNDELGGWLKGMEDIVKDFDEKEAKANAILDKIIVELEAVDPCWWANYSGGAEVARYSYAIQQAVMLANGDENFNKARRLALKRTIVRQSVIPAMHACIRAGFVTPVEQEGA